MEKFKKVIKIIAKRLSYIIKGSKMEGEIEMLKAENEALKQENIEFVNKYEELKNKDSKIAAENKDLNYYIKEVFPEILVTFEDNTTAAYKTFLKVLKRDKFNEPIETTGKSISKDKINTTKNRDKVDDITFINA